jgi:hypothetical protein
VLELDELTVLTAWAEGVSEVAAYAPERIEPLLAAAGVGATWRAELDLPEPSPRLSDAIESLGRLTRAASSRAGTSSFDALLTAAQDDQPGETALDEVARRALLSMLEERRTREGPNLVTGAGQSVPDGARLNVEEPASGRAGAVRVRQGRPRV